MHILCEKYNLNLDVFTLTPLPRYLFVYILAKSQLSYKHFENLFYTKPASLLEFGWHSKLLQHFSRNLQL